MRVRGVGDGGDVALAAARAGPTARPAPGTTTAGVRAVAAASASAPSLHGTSSGASREAPALERALPEPVAARAVAGGRRVEADRARRGHSSAAVVVRVEDRARVGARRSRARGGARAPRAQPRSVSASVRTSRGGAAAATRDARARAPQRGGQLGVGGAQAGRRAERDEQHVGAGHRLPFSRPAMTGTFLNTGTILLGTLIGWLLGARLPDRVHERVLAGLGMVTLVIGVDLALAWRDTNALYVLGGVLLGGVDRRADRDRGPRGRALGDRLQRWLARAATSTRASRRRSSPRACSSASARWRWSARSRTALTGDYQALCDQGRCSTGSRRSRSPRALGPGVAFAALSVLVIQGAISLGRRALRRHPRRGQRGAARRSPAPAACSIIGIA